MAQRTQDPEQAPAGGRNGAESPAGVVELLEGHEIGDAEERSETALATGGAELQGELRSTGLLAFYDRLRGKVVQTAETKAGKLPSKAVKALLLVPDVFMLLVRLAMDKEVPGPTRALIGGAIAYFILPTDLLPEALIGGAGYLEDLVLAAAVLSQAFGGELETYTRRHWSGSEELRTVLRDLTTTANSLLGENIYARLKKLLGRRGIELEGGKGGSRARNE
ncbi:MAG TPA: YkvA family protein [Thermoanaerobaculia bacterium]|nr:YkvA family protein [Thermoanaerobaculia bacterium]